MIRLQFNLIDSPWLDVVDTSGGIHQLSIRELFEKCTEIKQLTHPSPVVFIAQHRLLLAILHRALNGPAHYGINAEWLEEGQFPKGHVEAYLDKWHERFELFHDVHPFYQVADSQEKVKSVASIAPDKASGTNKLLFDHSTDASPPELPIAEIVNLLLSRQVLAIPEGAGYSPSPIGGTACVLANGNTLFETLVLNLVPYIPERNEFDSPVWEQAALTTKDVRSGKAEHIFGITQAYTWVSRSIKLEYSEDTNSVQVLLYAAGKKPDLATAMYQDPMVAYDGGKKGDYRALSFRKDKSFWRDSHALIPCKNITGYLPPETLVLAQNILNDELGRDQSIGVTVAGLTNDKAKVELWRTEQFSLPQSLMDSTVYNEFKKLLDFSDDVNKTLWSASAKLARGLLTVGDRNPDKADIRKLVDSFQAGNYYWSQLEIAFPELLKKYEDNSEEAKLFWYRQLLNSLKKSWQLAQQSAGQSNNVWKAKAEADPIIYKRINELKAALPKEDTGQNPEEVT